MGSFSEILSLHSINNLSTETRNMSGSRRTSARRSAFRKWLKACKNATKDVLRKTFNLQCRASEISFKRDAELSVPSTDNFVIIDTETIEDQYPQIQPTSHIITRNNWTTESNISFTTDEDDTQFETCTQNGRELDPAKMFASLDANLLSLARQNLKSTNFKVCPGHVQEKIKLFEKRISGINQEENFRKDEKKILCGNLQQRVRFFERFAKTENSEECWSEIRSEARSTWNSKEDEIHVVNEDVIVPVKVVEPVTNCENLIEDRTVWILIEELHKQCYFMKQANNLIEACLKVKAFQYGKVHLQAEKLLLLSCLKRDMLLRKIRKLQFPEENQTRLKSGVIRAEISDLRFSICKEHKNKKASYIVVCSNENDMHASHVIKAKSEKEFISIPEVHSFENLDEDCRLNISVYQVNHGKYFNVLQLMNEKNNKSRKKISIQYKDADSGIVVQDQVLEPLYKAHNSLEIDFTNPRNVTVNCSEDCSLQGLLTLELFEGKFTFTI